MTNFIAIKLLVYSLYNDCFSANVSIKWVLAGSWAVRESSGYNGSEVTGGEQDLAWPLSGSGTTRCPQLPNSGPPAGFLTTTRLFNWSSNFNCCIYKYIWAWFHCLMFASLQSWSNNQVVFRQLPRAASFYWRRNETQLGVFSTFGVSGMLLAPT